MIRDREINFEMAAFRQLAFHGDEPAVLLHDTVSYGKPEPRAFPDILGRKEGLEYPLQGLLAHADPAVADRDADEAVLALGAKFPAWALALSRSAQADLDGCVFRAGLDGIYHEIRDDLLQLGSVGNHLGHRLAGLEV